MAVNSSGTKMYRSGTQWEGLAAQRPEWREIVKRQVHEFEEQRTTELDAKRDDLKARPSAAI